MSTYARIQNGVVMELFNPPPNVPITACFNAALTWVECDSVPGVGPGWTYDGTNFSAPAAPPAPTLSEQASTALAGGCQIASTSTPSLNATYACTPSAIMNIQAEMISILVNGTFTNGNGSISWPDVTGTPRTFTVAQFKAFATAMGGFVGTLSPIASGMTGTLPTLPLTIT